MCLVQNPGFNAAAVVYDAVELHEFTQPDLRPKLWYMVPIDKLTPDVIGVELEAYMR